LSAALQLPLHWAGNTGSINGSLALQPQLLASAVHHIRRQAPPAPEPDLQPTPAQEAQQPIVTWAFYRRHTEKLLRRYLYASMQIGRTPNLLAESVGRGWVSSRKVRTFEDALIFVLDVERCLKRLSPCDSQIVSRVILQEYTQVEAAPLLGMSIRTLSTKLPKALDRLTEYLVAANLLVISD
jgi:DNA-directed RNA polymerase specialized sigma24 family protein